MAYLEEMAPGQRKEVRIQARIRDDISPSAHIVNRASVLYRESVAVQAVAELDLATKLPVTGIGLPVIGLALALALLLARQLRRAPAR